MSRRRAWLAPALVALAVLAPAAPAAATEVTSFVEPPTTEVGGRVVFVIEVRSGIGTRVRFPDRLALTGLDRLGAESFSQSIYAGSLGTGRLSRVSWALVATEEGTARIGPATVEIGGEPVEVPGASVEVTAAPSGRPRLAPQRPAFPVPFPQSPFGSERARPSQPSMYLRAEAGPLEPWVGQQVVYTLWAYTTGPFNQPNLEAPARFPGFWAEDVDLGDPSALFERVWIEGRMYFRVPLLRRLLFPLAAGARTIEPLMISLEPGRSFSDPFARRRAAGRVQLESNPVTIEARALPEPPAGFSGAVGQVELDARLEPEQVAVGEHATLEVAVSGRGNLQGLSAPEIAVPEGLDLLPPEEESGSRVAGVELSGRRTWRYALVPRGPGSYRLRAPEVVFFDPAAGAYRSTAGSELELAVTPRVPDLTASAEGEPPSGREADAAAGWLGRAPTALAELAAALGPVRIAVAAGLATLAAVILWLALRVRHRSTRGPAGLWRRQLEDARQADRPRRAAAAIEAAWRQLLAERWRISPEIPPASWEDSLRHAGARPEAAAELGELTRELQALRRAPELSSIGALTEDLIARSLRLERALA